MNVLSLFDGISAGRLALERANIKVDNYYSSEIDKYAIQISNKNYPNIIQIGSITDWNNWDIDFSKIDLVMGGSPCQGFSFAGKQLNFQDERSRLFFDYVNVLNHIKSLNPNVKFLLENVRMKQEYQDVITTYMGVSPIVINSSLLSAQNRVRYYWTNIENVEQPIDKELVLSDILEETVEDKFYLSYEAIDYMSRLRNGKQRWEYHKNPINGKSACLTANMYKGVPYGVIRYNSCQKIATLDMKGHDNIKRVYDEYGKSPCLTSITGGNHQAKVFDYEKESARKLIPLECERLQTFPDNYTEGVSNSQRYKALGNSWTVDVISHIFKNLK